MRGNVDVEYLQHLVPVQIFLVALYITTNVGNEYDGKGLLWR